MEKVLARAIEAWRVAHCEEEWIGSGLAAIVPRTTSAPSSSSTTSPDVPQNTSPDVPQTTSSSTPSLGTPLLTFIASIADGDCRVALNGLEVVLKTIEIRSRRAMEDGTELAGLWTATELDKLKKGLKDSLSLSHDRTGDARYDLISALHKSMSVCSLSAMPADELS